MGPRKKPKRSDDAVSEADSNRALQQSDKACETDAPTRASPSQADVCAGPEAPKGGGAPRSSRYAGGSWRSKAAPVAQVARESIFSAAGGVTSDSSSDVVKKDSASNTAIKFLDRRSSAKSPALAASTTNAIATSGLASDSKVSLASAVKESGEDAEDTKDAKDAKDANKPGEGGDNGKANVDNTGEVKSDAPKAGIDPPLPPDPARSNDEPGAATTGSVSRQKEMGLSSYIPVPSLSRAWYGWWSRPDGYVGSDSKESGKCDTGPENTKATPLPDHMASEDSTRPGGQHDLNDGNQIDPESLQTPMDADLSNDNAEEKVTPTRSWFWLWSATQNAQQEPSTTVDHIPSESAVAPVPPQEDRGQASSIQNQAKVPTSAEDQPPIQNITKRSAGWAFWSHATPQAKGETDAELTQKQVGELAVADTPSQSHPEAAQFTEHQEEQQKAPARSITGSIRTGRGKKPQVDSQPSVPVQATPQDASPVLPNVEESPARKTAHDTGKQMQPPCGPECQNLLYPEFKNTYCMFQSPSYWGKVSPRIKKALAIGVHGYFPAVILQKVLGQPTGTSIRFANAAAAAIQSWTEGQGYVCETEKVALEGEGLVSDRVDILWKLLLNWINHIKSADFILVACHSQGVPVALMLVAKLIQFDCVNGARIGVCAMAGVNLGPFPEYRSRFLGGSAGELFEFSRPGSLVSQKYQGALRVALSYGVRIVYVGSIDDQLVSLESSVFSNISHPYIYRAVFVDGRIHAPDFITHLVGFALKLRNLGLPDHGLVRELSPALAGSLYGGEGHSRLYTDAAVYNLAVQHALETVSLPGAMNPPLQIKEYEGTGPTGSNPYFLPWAMRGLLEEDFVRRELSSEVDELLALFEGWKPTTKPLKDIKFRLEAVKSKL